MTKSVQPQLSPEEFDAQFREIANQLRVAPIETIDDCYARLLKLLSYSEATLVAFLKRCTGAQLQTALTALDMAVVVQASPAVVEALEQTARRLPEYDLESCLLAARSAFAKKIVLALNGTDDATRQERFAELLRQAEKGKASAQFRVALHYYFGNCVEKDYEQAQTWAEKAREQGYPPALLFFELPR